MRSLRFSSTPLILSVLAMGSLLAFSPVLLRADGDGVVFTPYQKGATVTAKMVADFKKDANKIKPASGYEEGTGVCSNVKFAYLVPDVTGYKPFYALTGKTPEGKTRKIELSVLNALVIRSLDTQKQRLLCDVEVFPTLSPAEIVTLQPSFTLLDTKYKTTMPLWIDLKNSQGGLLFLIGDSADGKEAVKVAFEKMPLNKPILFNAIGARASSSFKKTYWWAIPSVTDDPRYPNKLHTVA